MKDRSDDLLHHERTLLPRSYISFPGERENLLPPLHGLLFPINNKRSLICTIPQTGEHTLQPLLTCHGALLEIDRTMSGRSTTELHLAPTHKQQKTKQNKINKQTKQRKQHTTFSLNNRERVGADVAMATTPERPRITHRQ